MLLKKKNQIKDERIEKESNKLMPPMFYLFSVEMLVCLVLKLVLGEPWYNFTLEILCLVPAWIYVLVKRVQNGILVIKEKDEALLAIRDNIVAKAFMISFWVILIGEMIYMYLVVDVINGDSAVWVKELVNGVVSGDGSAWPRELTWLFVYLAVWFVPAIIITVFTLKKGWLIWGSKKREVTGKKEFAKRTAIGALFFGLIMGAPELFDNGVFQPKGLLIIVLTGAAWGLFFYFFMTAFIKRSEKNADKAVEGQEGSDEE